MRRFIFVGVLVALLGASVRPAWAEAGEAVTLSPVFDINLGRTAREGTVQTAQGFVPAPSAPDMAVKVDIRLDMGNAELHNTNFSCDFALWVYDADSATRKRVVSASWVGHPDNDTLPGFTVDVTEYHGLPILVELSIPNKFKVGVVANLYEENNP